MEYRVGETLTTTIHEQLNPKNESRRIIKNTNAKERRKKGCLDERPAITIWEKSAETRLRPEPPTTTLLPKGISHVTCVRKGRDEVQRGAKVNC